MPSKNNSGVHPISDRVLVQPDETVEVKGGLIVVPEDIKKQYALSQTYGAIVEYGPTAFKYEFKNYEVDQRREDGVRVMFAKYAGIVIRGKDGKDYRLLRDDDITAFVDSDVKLEIGA